MRHMILVLLYSSGVSVCVGSLESLVNCEFNQSMCKWTDYGFNDENYVPTSMSVCGRNGNIRDCGNYDSSNWANSWRMENITNYTFYNIPPDVDVYGKMMIFADNFDKGQIYADHFTFSLMYSPGISADPTQARCLKYRYLLTANASLVVSYQTDLSVFEHDIPLTGHSGSQAFNLTDGYTQLPFVNKFRHNMKTFLLFLCSTSTCLGTLEKQVNCDFKTDLCSWRVDNIGPVFREHSVRLCGLNGRGYDCRIEHEIYPANHWRIGTITNNSLYNIPSDVEMKDKVMLFSDNLNAVAETTTSLLYSPFISIDPTKPHCLKYKYITTRDASLTISYLTDIGDIFDVTDLQTPGTSGATDLKYLNVTHGDAVLPFTKEFRIHIRATFKSKLPSVAMLGDVQILHGLCPRPCPEKYFECDSSECVRTDQVCDGRIDCSDVSDERFCEWNSLFVRLVDSTLNCSSVTLSELSNVNEINDGKTIMEKSPNDAFAVKSFWAVHYGCLNVSETFDIVDLRQFFNDSNLLFCYLILDNNRSVFLIPSNYSSQSSINCTQMISNWCQCLNISTKNEFFTFEDSISRTLKRCSDIANLECVSPFLATYMLTSVTCGSLFMLISNEPTIHVPLSKNKSTVITNINRCMQLVNSFQNTSNVDCLKKEETLRSFSLNGSRLIMCEGCLDIKKSSEDLHDTNTTNVTTIGSNCPNDSIDCSRLNSDNPVTCFPFCPAGCNCTGKSYICVRDRCPAFTESIVLNNIECTNLVYDDQTRVYFVKSKHIIKLEINNSVIKNLRIFSYNSFSLHRISIMHSTIGYIYLNPYFDLIRYTTLHSFHFYNVTLHKIYGYLFHFRLVAKKASFHFLNATFNFNPDIWDISENNLEDFLDDNDQYLLCNEVINVSHNAIKHMFEVRARILDLSHNRISSYLDFLSGVEVLYMNNNRIKSLKQRQQRYQYVSLRIADFSYNNITSINAGDLLDRKLIYLNFSRNQIRNIHPDAFVRTSLLIYLDLSYNEISHVTHGTFLPLINLEELYLQGNTFRVAVDMFKGLYSLRIMEVGFYTICCAKPNSKHDVQCIAPVAEISSCEQLIDVPVLNVAILYMAAIATFGNLIVFLYNVGNYRRSRAGPYKILTMNLSCADFLMGFYLYIIAYINLHYTGEYGLNDYVWRHSTICTFAGITATLSSEISAFIVLLITLDRFIAVKFPFSNLKLTIKRASMLLFIAWVVSLCLAFIPLIPDPNLENFYAQSGICVSLPLSVTRKPGWQYSMIVYVGINFLLFLGILIGQIAIFVEVISVGRNVRSTRTNQRESSLAMTLFAIVLTDVFCWIPIGTIGMLTFLGIEVQSDVHAWMIVVVLPINSAINPILYTLTAVIRMRKRKAKESPADLTKQLDTAENTRTSEWSIDERTTNTMSETPSHSGYPKD